MCGLFGFIPKKGKKANLLKLKILGIFNTERGTDSCGYYYAGHIGKGINKESDFKDFICNNELIRGDMVEDVFIGHTRRSTHGGHSINNAHPHLINDRYIQTHNGVIENWTELCNKYGIPTEPIYVDSIGLGSIIEKNGFEVLNEYIGKAVLVMTFKDNPGSVFLYRGASKTTANGAIEDERPLYLIQEPEGIYYSSLKNSLEAIRSSLDVDVKYLNVNNVWEVKNGDINKAKSVFKVNRENINVKKLQSSTSSVSAKSTRTSRMEKYTSIQNFSKNYSKTNNNRERDKVYLEEFTKDVGGYGEFRIDFCKGRYFNPKTHQLLTGNYHIDDSGVVLATNIGINLINKAKTEKQQPKVREFWFLNGVLLKKGQNSFNTLRELGFLVKNPSEEYLSHHSYYPVIANSREAEFKSTQWFKNGKPVYHKDTFSPIFSKNTYSIKNGKTAKIKKQNQLKIVI